MTETATIYKGDTAGPWKLGHLLDDGSLATLDANYSCSIKVAGTAIERAVTDKNSDGDRFLAALTPTETDSLDVGQYVVAIELVNSTLTPPLSIETHIILAVEEQIVGSDYVPAAETEVQRLYREISEAKAQRHKVALGGSVIEVWRDGRRMRMQVAGLADLDSYISGLEREYEQAVATTSGKPRRRPIKLAWQN